MVVKKKILAHLPKCYSLGMLQYNGSNHIVVATEKAGDCLLFDLEGNLKETIWKEPGGTMSIVQVPHTNGHFLATHRFYSPNDGEKASIVYVKPTEHGTWDIRTVLELPYVHRFDIIKRNNNYYLIACTIKSGLKFKDDWSSPGKVYATLLPIDLDSFLTKGETLELEIIKDGMVKNHGYYKHSYQDYEYALISSEEGVYKFFPPENSSLKWEVQKISSMSASDAVLFDIDGDGIQELFVFSPFHGSHFTVFKPEDNIYKEYYKHPSPLEFLHALYVGEIGGKPSIVVGHRGGDGNLLLFTSDRDGKLFFEYIDSGFGPANAFIYHHNNKDIIIATNRETDQVAMYELSF